MGFCPTNFWTMSLIKTAIIDHQTLFVEGLTALIQKHKYPAIRVVGTYDSVEDFIEKYSFDLDLVILEINLPDADGLEYIPKLRNLSKSLRIIVLTSFGEMKFVKEAMKNGADGFLLKSNAYSDFVSCVDEVMDGNTYLADGLRVSPPVTTFAFTPLESKKPQYEDRYMMKQKLTRREKEILSLITQAKSNKEIADELFISDQTVGVHRKNIMRKLGVKNTLTLVKFAMEHQLV